MANQFHILNGDVLKAQLPTSIKGTKLIARECMITGNVQGNTIDEIFENRARFMETSFQEKNYFQKVVSEFDRISRIPDGSAIHLWFEDDLFCQSNLWFVIYFLLMDVRSKFIFLVRPNKKNPYSFGHMTATELEECFGNRILLEHDELLLFSELWTNYQQSAYDKMLQIGKNLRTKFPFLLPAIQAHIEREPDETGFGRPEKSLQTIVEDLNSQQFEPVFKEFCKREAIYGFGDVQVKQMFDKVLERK